MNAKLRTQCLPQAVVLAAIIIIELSSSLTSLTPIVYERKSCISLTMQISESRYAVSVSSGGEYEVSGFFFIIIIDNMPWWLNGLLDC